MTSQTRNSHLQGHDLFPVFFGSTPIVPHTSSVDVPLALSQKMSASLFGGGQQLFHSQKKKKKKTSINLSMVEGLSERASINESITSGLSFVEESNQSLWIALNRTNMSDFIGQRQRHLFVLFAGGDCLMIEVDLCLLQRHVVCW